MIKKIISGGQTGADQATLDAAIKLGIPHDGWIPKGRKTEDGILPYTYKLKEFKSAGYGTPNAMDRDDLSSTVLDGVRSNHPCDTKIVLNSVGGKSRNFSVMFKG